MTTDKTPATLATAKHGGCVQLATSERERFEAWCPYDTAKWPSGHYVNDNAWHAWNGWAAAMGAKV